MDLEELVKLFLRDYLSATVWLCIPFPLLCTVFPEWLRQHGGKKYTDKEIRSAILEACIDGFDDWLFDDLSFDDVYGMEKNDDLLIKYNADSWMEGVSWHGKIIPEPLFGDTDVVWCLHV